METWAIVLAGAILLGAAGIAAVVGLLTARLGGVLARLETRAAPILFIEQVSFVPYVRVSYGELQSTAWGHIPLTFPSATPGLWDVLTSCQDAEIRMRGWFAVKNAGGGAVPPRVKYRCFFRGEPCGGGTHQSANPLAPGESVSFRLDVALPMTTPAIGVGDLVTALRIETPGAPGPLLFWYDSSTNEWRQDMAGLDPELLARIVV
jgi:hypothetical protein